MTEDYRQLAEEALARAEKAAPGPWVVDSYDGCRIESAEDAKGRYMTIYDEGGHRPEEAEFIAAARTDVPALARAVLELSKGRDHYEALWLRALDRAESDPASISARLREAPR